MGSYKAIRLQLTNTIKKIPESFKAGTGAVTIPLILQSIKHDIEIRAFHLHQVKKGFSSPPIVTDVTSI